MAAQRTRVQLRPTGSWVQLKSSIFGQNTGPRVEMGESFQLDSLFCFCKQRQQGQQNLCSECNVGE